MYGRVTLTGHQVPTKAAPAIALSTGQTRENAIKDLRIEVRAGRHQPPITIMGKIYSTWERN